MYAVSGLCASVRDRAGARADSERGAARDDRAPTDASRYDRDSHPCRHVWPPPLAFFALQLIIIARLRSRLLDVLHGTRVGAVLDMLRPPPHAFKRIGEPTY